MRLDSSYDVRVPSSPGPPTFSTELLRLHQALSAGLLIAIAGCAAPPMRWEKPGADPAKDEAECRAEAHQEAIRQLPYGNGPPLYGLSSEMSMLQWTMAIDNERSYLEQDLTNACMHHKGFELVPAAGPRRSDSLSGNFQLIVPPSYAELHSHLAVRRSSLHWIRPIWGSSATPWWHLVGLVVARRCPNERSS